MADDEADAWVAAEMEELEVESRSVTPACDNHGLLVTTPFEVMAILFSFHYFHSMNIIHD